MTSDIKLYYVTLARRKKKFFPKHYHITYHSKGLSLLIILYQKNDLETNMTFSKSFKLETL